MMTVSRHALSARRRALSGAGQLGSTTSRGREPTPVREPLKLPAVVELIFMMLILKLPILYLAGVCYWAIKAEPKPLEAARVTAPLDPGPWSPLSPSATATDLSRRAAPS